MTAGHIEHEHQAAEHHAEPVAVAVSAVPVLVTNPDTLGANVNPQAADYGAYSSFTMTATQAAQSLLPFDQHRARAIVTLSAGGPVFIGTQAQTQASPPQGYQLTAAAPSLEIKSNQAVYIAPDGTHTATVSLLAERWGDSAGIGD